MADKSYYFLNLGCPKNQVDGDYVRGALNTLGLIESDSPEEVEYIIVNTCAFIEQARRETIGEINELLPYRKNGAKLLAIGCYPVLYNIKKDIPAVDYAFGLNQVQELLNYISGNRDICFDSQASIRAVEDSPFAYIKISDGCDNRCSYCTIPLIRGAFRSIHPELILKEVELLARSGIKEMVLVAQDTALYGKDLDEEIDLARLCRMISKVDGVEWIRVMYAHPAHLSEDLTGRLFEIDKVCRYLDIPIQHISDKILKLMNRHCDSEKIKQVIKQLRNIDKSISLRTTLMTGFPGETDDDFKSLLDFIEAVEFDYLGAFYYSPEEMTTAKTLNDVVDQRLAEERLDLLYDIAEDISMKRARMQIGKKQKLLIEALSPEDPNYYEARSYRQAPDIDGFYKIQASSNLKPGEFVDAVIRDVDIAIVLEKNIQQVGNYEK